VDQEGFSALCRATSLALQVEDTEKLFSAGEIDIDDIAFGIFFEPDIAPDRILCYIDLGAIPDEGREDIFSRLLSLNVISGTKTSGVYGIDKDGENALFVQHFMYPELLSGEQFALILKSYAFHAKTLQTTILNPAYMDSTEEALRHSLMSNNLLSV
jgi:hypothetical protein